MKTLLIILTLFSAGAYAKAAPEKEIAKLTFYRKSTNKNPIVFKIIESSDKKKTSTTKMSLKDGKKAEKVKPMTEEQVSLFTSSLNSVAWELEFKMKKHSGRCQKSSELYAGMVKTVICQDEKKKRALIEGRVRELMDFMK